MKVSISLMGLEVVGFSVSIPRLNLLAPMHVPESLEVETMWGDDD